MGLNVNYVTWKEAEIIASEYQNKDYITSIFFIDNVCNVCNEFVLNELVPYIKDIDDYRMFLVNNIEGMLFPPTNFPTGYIFIPNCPNVMPLRRVGNAPMKLVKRDILRQITSMKTGKDLDELRNIEG